MKRFASLCAVLLLVVFSALPVFAAGESSEAGSSSQAPSASSASSASSKTEEGTEYAIPELNITVRIPDSMYVFEKDKFTLSDPNLSKAGVTDLNEFSEKFTQYNLQLDAISEDASLEIGFYKKETEETQSYYNLKDLSEEEYGKFLEKMQPDDAYQEENNLSMEVESYDEHPETRFFITRIEMDKSEAYNHSISEVCYATIINGYTLTVDAVVLDAKISPEQEALVKQIVDSIHITKLIDKSEAEYISAQLSPQDYFTAFGSLALIVGVIVALIVSRASRKRAERQRRLLADRLAQYRFEEQEKQEKAAEEGRAIPEPETICSNRTEYSEAAVRSFIAYHVSHRRLPTILIYTVVSIAFLLFAALSNMDIVMRILLAAMAVVILVWELLMPSKLKKAQMALLKSSPNKRNEYYFHKKDFRVTGMQSSSLYPYFQITHVGENKEYFFLYFGEETAYYVSKSGFTGTDADAFRDFIRERIKQA